MHVLYCKQQIQLGNLGLQVQLFTSFVIQLFKENLTHMKASSRLRCEWKSVFCTVWSLFPSCLVSALLFLVIKLRLSTRALLVWPFSARLWRWDAEPAQVRPRLLPQASAGTVKSVQLGFN